MTLTQLEKLGSKVISEILELRAQNWGLRKICSYLNDKYGYHINHMTLKRYLDKKGAMHHSFIEANANLKNRIQKEIIDTVSQMKEVNKKLWDLINELEVQGKAKNVMKIVATMNLILKQLEMQNKWLNQLTAPKSATYNVNIIDMAIKVNKIIKELQDKRYIGVQEDKGVITVYKELQDAE